jgi:hypothetical protein
LKDQSITESADGSSVCTFADRAASVYSARINQFANRIELEWGMFAARYGFPKSISQEQIVAGD